jgi:hypothetical protein
MSKITLATVGSLTQNPTTAQQVINNNYSIIQTAFDNTLSRDDTQPDQMVGNLDMNNNQILNLPPPSTASAPLRLADATLLNGSGTLVTGVPAGGTTGQALTKNTASNYDTGWSTINPIPAGGTTGQVLTKNSNTDYDTSWQTPGAIPIWSTGDAKITLKTTADTGWILCNDGTIGDASSGGTTRANADTSALFTLLWNLPVGLTVSGGRGASASADFAAHKNIVVPLVLGRALAGAGAGSGLTNRVLASSTGFESYATTLVTANLPPYTPAGSISVTHDAARENNASSTPGGGSVVNSPQNATITATFTGTAQGGTSTPFNTSAIPPITYFNIMIKL